MTTRNHNINISAISLFLLLFTSLYSHAQYDIEVVNIENAAVQAYMNDDTYLTNDDYKYSIVTKYDNRDRYGKNLDWPAGKLVTWERVSDLSDIAGIEITVSENRRFHHPSTHTTDSRSDTSYIIRNTIPERTYYYKVEERLNNNDRIQVAQGIFRTTGQVRMIQVRGVSNVRDMGGWPTQYGIPIRYGKLFRSANLDRITQRGIHDFKDNLNVGGELDLRGEAKITSSPLGEDVDYLHITHGSYEKALNANQERFVRDLQWMVSLLKQGKSVDWHCAIGCDRCGTLSFLIGGLLGMDEVSLCRDYELSTFAFPKEKRERLYMRALLRTIRTYGPSEDLALCFYNYWKAIGANESDLDYFLTVMLDI